MTSINNQVQYQRRMCQSTDYKFDAVKDYLFCPICGHIERANRDKKIHLFTCKNRGYKSNDDRIGAMNLYRMGINYLEDSQVPDTVTAE